MDFQSYSARHGGARKKVLQQVGMGLNEHKHPRTPSFAECSASALRPATPPLPLLAEGVNCCADRQMNLSRKIHFSMKALRQGKHRLILKDLAGPLLPQMPFPMAFAGHQPGR